MQHSGRIARLAQVPILAPLSEQSLGSIAQSCAWRQHEAGSQILGYQEPSTHVFFLLAGRARVIIYSLEGKAVVFADLKPGAMFGEIAAIDGKWRSASIEALEMCSKKIETLWRGSSR